MASMQLEHRGIYVLARFSGNVGLQDLNHLNEAMEFCKQHDCEKILLVLDEARIELNYSERITLGLELARTFPLWLLLGILFKPEQTMEGRPFKLVVQNRSLNIRFFEKSSEAYSWATAEK